MNLIQTIEQEEVARLTAGKDIPEFQPGDTLSGIALSNGVSPNRLAVINGLSNLDLIVAGMMLDLPSNGSRASLAISSSRPPTCSPPSARTAT